MNVDPFTIAVPQTDLDDLQQRLAQTRWPDELPGSGWDTGSNLTYMKELVSYWHTATASDIGQREHSRFRKDPECYLRALEEQLSQ